MSKVRIQIVCLLQILFWLAATSAQAQSEHVYLVKIFDCKPAPNCTRIQTGFRVRGLKGIVTALHGVADAGNIRVIGDYGAAKFKGPLRVGKVDIAHDVALLTSAEIETAPADGLEVAEKVNWEDVGTINLIGRPLGLPANLATSLTLRRPALKPLRDLLMPEIAVRLLERKSPDPDEYVVSIAAVILPGDSGAPALDSRNRLLAVGNGGLLGGLSGINWAIPWQSVRLVDAASKESRLSALRTLGPGILDSSGLHSFASELYPTGDTTSTESNKDITYYFLRKGHDLQKFSLGAWPLGLTGVDAAGRIGEDWKLNTTFDFNGDRIYDIFGQNQTDGELRVWYGSPKGQHGGDISIGRIGPEWQLQVARFVRGGGVDIFGHNRSPRQGAYYQEIHIWRTNGSKITSDTKLGNIGLEWNLQLGDFNGDGVLDIFGVNTENGDLHVWFIKALANRTLVSTGNESIGRIGREWQLHVADMNKDGYADIFGHTANNKLWVWNNFGDRAGRRQLDGGRSFGKLGTEWQRLQVTDLNGDGFPDLLGQATNGELRGWYSNGQAFTSDSNLGQARARAGL